MQLNEVTRSHVRAQSSANLNLYSTLYTFPVRFTLVTRMQNRGCNLLKAENANKDEPIRTRFLFKFPDS